MPPIETFIAFLAAAAIFAYIPGPAMIYSAAQTIARGRSAGLMAVLGLHVGGYAHIIAAAAGLSALFHLVPVLFTIVKLVGAAYLILLGIRLFFRKDSPRGAVIAGPPKTARKAFFESVAVELLNPKTAIFFLAFLPQFTDPSGTLPLWGQFLVLGMIVNLMFTSADLVSVAMADALVNRIKQSSRTQKIIQRIGGGLLVGLGANLALQRS